ncbi:hypothetical protein GUJ93_ZPchr0007g3866 [Zizania palustris]|uniref:Uncharacterized protein n=1 Tax=Zizania palustris TaxID=103762 RepID=A0A8J5SPC3_ZIZPA|nr:hypothetical protein GUJ93_ZPchr0007g3866 [Zizania palustris]
MDGTHGRAGCNRADERVDEDEDEARGECAANLRPLWDSTLMLPWADGPETVPFDSKDDSPGMGHKFLDGIIRCRPIESSL